MLGSSAAATLGWLVVLAPLVVLAAEVTQVVCERTFPFRGRTSYRRVPESAGSLAILFRRLDFSEDLEFVFRHLLSLDPSVGSDFGLRDEVLCG